MFSLPSLKTSRSQAALPVEAPATSTSTQKAALVAPNAPRQTNVGGTNPAGGHPSQAGAFFGRLAKPAAAALLGANLLLAGCASLGPSTPEGPAAAHPEVAQYVQHFTPGADQNSWTLAREPSHTAPAQMAAILDLVAKARFSDDGKFALVLDPIEGSKAHYSPWNHTELRSLVSALDDYAASGAFAQVDLKTAQAFFDEIVPVFSEVGPAAHSGYGLDVGALNRIEEHLLTLEKQHLEAQGKG